MGANATITPPERTADEQLGAAVAKTFAWHFWIPKNRVRAEVKDGWVTLKGNVEWLFQKSGIEKAVASVPGVRGITNSIEIVSQQPWHAPGFDRGALCARHSHGSDR